MKRVVIVQAGLVVGEVISDFLKNQTTGMKVYTIVPRDATELDRIIDQYRPDIIIADDTIPENILAAIMISARRSPCLRLVLISANENRIQILDSQSARVAHKEDFLTHLYGLSTYLINVSCDINRIK